MASRARTETVEVGGGRTLLVIVGLGVMAMLIFNLLQVAKAHENFLTEANLLFLALTFYAAATAVYVGFAVTGEEGYVPFASAATFIGLVANTAAGAHRWYTSGHPPFSSVYEMLLSFVWTVALLTLVLERRFHVKVIGTVTMPVAVTSVVLMQLLPADTRPLVPALQSTWLHIHVTLAMLSYAAFAVSFALAMMFLIQDRMKTETFLAYTSGFLAAIYGAILAARFDPSGALHVIGWDAQAKQEIFLNEKARLMVSIPNLGYIFALVLVAVLAPLALYGWARLRKEDRAYGWANRAFVVGMLLQGIALLMFVTRAQPGSAYAAWQTEGFAGTSLQASPFLLAGIVGGMFASLLYLMMLWRRDGLERMMPPAEVLDRLTYKTIGIAFPLLTLMIAAGAYWANRTWGSYWSWDPKEDWALITWVIYAAYLHMRIARGWRGRRAAYFAVLGFAVVVFTFLGVTYLLPGLHAYS